MLTPTTKDRFYEIVREVRFWVNLTLTDHSVSVKTNSECLQLGVSLLSMISTLTAKMEKTYQRDDYSIIIKHESQIFEFS